MLEQLPRGSPVLRVIENRGKAPLQLPGREEVRPVDVLRDGRERHVVEIPPADKRRRRDVVLVPVVLQPVRERLLVGEQRLLAAGLVAFAHLLLRLDVAADERAAPFIAQQARDDVDDARRVEDVDDRV